MVAVNSFSPRRTARIAGWLYLATTVLGAGSDILRGPLIVRTDAVATAHHILAAEPFYRATIAAEFLAGACYVAVTAILYVLLNPVNRTLSLAAAFFSLAGCAVGAASLAFALAPTLLLGGAAYLSVFTDGQLQALSLWALKIYGQGYTVGMLFFGIYCGLLGLLMLRSTFFPRFLGILLILAGLGWLTDSFAEIVVPAFDRLLDPWIEAPGFIGEMALCVWLIVVGVDEPRWIEARSTVRP